MPTALTEPTVKPIDYATLASVLLDGDLSKLDDEKRLSYHNTICDIIGLNPLVSGLKYTWLNGELKLYPGKQTADQLRALHKINTKIVGTEEFRGCYKVHVHATCGDDGREDDDFGIVNIENLKGQALADAMMKAVTKGKRRVTLSISGLGGMLDETEIETLPADVTAAPAPTKVTPLSSGDLRVVPVAPSGGETERFPEMPLPPATEVLQQARRNLNLPHQQYFIERLTPGVVHSKTKGDFRKWTIVLSNGQEMDTISEKLGKELERCVANNIPVWIPPDKLQQTAYGTKLLDFIAADKLDKVPF